MQKQILFIIWAVVFSSDSFADSYREESDLIVNQAVECANSLGIDLISGMPIVGDACFSLYRKNPNVSVLSILEEALSMETIPNNLSERNIRRAIRKIKGANIVGSQIYLQDDDYIQPPQF